MGVLLSRSCSSAWKKQGFMEVFPAHSWMCPACPCCWAFVHDAPSAEKNLPALPLNPQQSTWEHTFHAKSSVVASESFWTSSLPMPQVFQPGKPNQASFPCTSPPDTAASNCHLFVCIAVSYWMMTKLRMGNMFSFVN